MPSEQHRAQVRSRLSVRPPPAAARSGLIAASSAPGPSRASGRPCPDPFRPTRTEHDVTQAAQGEPPQCAQEHRPKDRRRKTAVTVQRHQARLDRRDRHRAVGRSRGVGTHAASLRRFISVDTVPWRQRDKASDCVIIDPGKHIGGSGSGIDVVQQCGLHQRVHHYRTWRQFGVISSSKRG